MNIDDKELKHAAALWDAVDSLIPGGLITEDEADDYVAGVLPAERLAIVEALLEKTPAVRDELHAQRDAAEADRIFTPARLKESVEGQPANVLTGQEWDTETDATGYFSVCFAPIALALGANLLDRSEKVAGPDDLLDSAGKRFSVLLNEMETEQGDVLITVEADKALGGRTLHLRGGRAVALPLRIERGKAFAMVSLSKADHATLCRGAEGRIEYGWT